MKKKDIFHHIDIGKNCFFQSTILPAEPFLVLLHDNVIISAGVRLITHTVSHTMFNYQDNTDEYICQHNKVEIHNNVYIGAGAIINLGVTIGENSIVAAGAIVTHDVPTGSVVAGVPTKVIGSYGDVKKRAKEYSKSFTYAGLKELCTVQKMVDFKPIKFDD